MNKHKLTLLTKLRLWRAGWRAGRDVWSRMRLPEGFVVFPQAERILREFGGLEFRGRSARVYIEPSCDDYAEQEIKHYEQVSGTILYPIGYIDGGDTLDIVVDPSGMIYLVYPLNCLEPFASSFEVALEYLSRGYDVRPEVQRRDLTAAGMRGRRWELNRQT